LDFLRRWRALKARFPRTGNTWRKLWQAPLTNRQYRDRPFIGWLKESEPALRKKWTSPVSVPIPPNIPEIIKDLARRSRLPNERPPVLAEAEQLLTNLEHYAEATGDAYFFVRSACNLGKAVLPWAPSHTLAWSRDALRWSPNNGHAWDLRGSALNHLGHPDIAQAVYWEAVRRLPNDAVLRIQLARFLSDQGRESEAEALFRETYTHDPGNAVARNELARLLARTGRAGEAEALFRETYTRDPSSAVARVEMEPVASDAEVTGCETVREEKARAALHPESGMYPVGSDIEIAKYGAVREQGAPDALYPKLGTQPIESDTNTTKRTAALEGEKRGAPFLRRAASTGRADLLFRIRDTAAAEQALTGLLADDPGDLYPQVVWALHVPGRRAALAGHYREALGALAPHLAAAGPETPTSHWERLYEAFPERRGLIDFTRLIRSGYEEAVAARLGDWIAGDEDDADAFLRAWLKKAVAEDGRIDPAAPGFDDLLNAVILAAVDLGDGVLGEAA